MATIIIGSARHDENNKYSGGAAGDQLQTSNTNDMSGEVSMQSFYVHKYGWYIMRLKSVTHANNNATAMKIMCNNKNVGYDQGNRNGIVSEGVDSDSPTECDCSSGVRECVKEATGVDPGNFTTETEVAKLAATGLFKDKIEYVSQSKTPVYNGDILVSMKKGHTAIVVSGNPRSSSTTTSSASTTSSKTATTTTASTSTSSSASASVPVKVTSTVKAVQTWLNTYYKTGLKVDGDYGSKTKAALVMAWQKEVGGGLKVDGEFGSKSKAAAKNVVIKSGSSGIIVTIWQATLVCNGYNPNGIDGDFGSGCKAATIKYQKAKGLTQDGQVGVKTWSAALG